MFILALMVKVFAFNTTGFNKRFFYVLFRNSYNIRDVGVVFF